MTYVNTFGTPASAYATADDDDKAKGVMMIVCSVLMCLFSLSLIALHMGHMHRLKTGYTLLNGVVATVGLHCELDHHKSHTPMPCARAEALITSDDYYSNASVAYYADITYRYRAPASGDTYEQMTTRRVNLNEVPRVGQSALVYVNKTNPAVSEYAEGGVGL